MEVKRLPCLCILCPCEHARTCYNECMCGCCRYYWEEDEDQLV